MEEYYLKVIDINKDPDSMYNLAKHYQRVTPDYNKCKYYFEMLLENCSEEDDIYFMALNGLIELYRKHEPNNPKLVEYETMLLVLQEYDQEFDDLMDEHFVDDDNNNDFENNNINVNFESNQSEKYLNIQQEDKISRLMDSIGTSDYKDDNVKYDQIMMFNDDNNIVVDEKLNDINNDHS